MKELGLIFNYEDHWVDMNTLTGQSGTITKTLTAVPAGYVYVLQSAYMSHNDATARRCLVRAYASGSVYTIIANSLALAQNDCVFFNGALVLKPGDYLGFVWFSLAANTYIEWCAWGYKMRLY